MTKRHNRNMSNISYKCNGSLGQRWGIMLEPAFLGRNNSSGAAREISRESMSSCIACVTQNPIPYHKSYALSQRALKDSRWLGTAAPCVH